MRDAARWIGRALPAGVILAVGLSGGVFGAARCPSGTTAVEDVATGKVTCEGGDTLRSGAPRRSAPGEPGAPGRPGAPTAPRRAKEPEPAGGSAASECGLSRWACEQACQRTYLSSATGPATDAAQRAKVALAACLRVCAKEFDCAPRAPEVPVK